MNNDAFIAYSPRIIKNESALSQSGIVACLCLEINASALSQPARVYVEALTDQPVSIGRGANNDMAIADIAISRQHIYLIYESERWFIEDSNSLNGCFINQKKIMGKQALTLPCEIHFGRSETILSLSLLELSNQVRINDTVSHDDDRTQIILPLDATHTTSLNTEKPPLHGQQQDSLLTEGEFKQSVNAVKKQYTEQVKANKTAHTTQQSLNADEIQEKLFSKKAAEDAGEYTQILRSMIHKDRKKKSRVYQYSLFFLVLLLSAVVAFAVYQQRILDNARTLALDMFYDIKEMEISLAKLELKLQNDLTQSADGNSIDSQASYEVQKAQQALREAQQAEADIKRKKLQEMQEKYQAYLKKLESIKLSRIKPPLISARRSQSSDYEEQLILDVAIKFGESELELPDEFYNKVHEYIVYWQSSSRLPKAMQHLANKNYAP
ncbi:MAG TPA: FHA domain-containing protein, partial [Thiothrix sp.]|nr:FHA domain-containing protein [Thiothrix sp.]